MLYRKLIKGGDDLSTLGFGCMRFVCKDGNIDEELAHKQMLLAYENGVNYYDTAYPYLDGKSEGLLGDFIKKYDLRDKIYIADKMPTYWVKEQKQLEEYFSTQLERLQTDYIDYYLMHALGSYEEWCKLKDLGITSFIEEKKAKNQIRYVGFSFHGRQEEFMKILQDYSWDFCQIQFNYLDEYYQAGLKGLKKAYELGIGVVIMEPLRGGSLGDKAPTAVKKYFNSKDTENSCAYWALRYVLNFEEVGLLLSGMNNVSHVMENIKAVNVSTPNSLTNDEIEMIEYAKKLTRSLMKVPCTGCNYCMPCPKGINIPQTFEEYNNKRLSGKRYKNLKSKIKSAESVPQNHQADICIKCGKCIKACPQYIEIPMQLENYKNSFTNNALRFKVKAKLKKS